MMTPSLKVDPWPLYVPLFRLCGMFIRAHLMNEHCRIYSKITVSQGITWQYNIPPKQMKDCDALLLYTNEQLLQFPWYVLKILSPNTSFLGHFRGYPGGSATAISPVLVSPSLINSLTRPSW